MKIIRWCLAAWCVLASAMAEEEAAPPEAEAAVVCEIFTAKDEIRSVVRCRTVHPDAVWLLDGVPAGEGSEFDFIGGPESWVMLDTANSSLATAVPVPEFQRRSRPAECEAGIVFFLPEVIYDDETRELYWEAVSKLPAALNFTVTIAPDRPNAMFAAETLTVPLGGRDPGDRFAPGEYRKFMVELDGTRLAEPLSVEWVMALPGCEFARRRIAFIPVAQLPELTHGVDGWYDAAGTRVIPVLHRRQLDEQRRLEFVRAVRRMLPAKKRLAVAAEEFPGFRESLAKAAAKRGYELEFIPWFAPGDLGRDWFAALPAALTALGGAEAGTVIVVPPSRRRLGPCRRDGEWARLIDLTLAAAWTGPAAERVILATPLADPAAGGTDGLEAELRRMLRSSTSELFEYRHCFTAPADWREAFLVGPAEYAATPDTAPDRAAEVLLKAL